MIVVRLLFVRLLCRHARTVSVRTRLNVFYRRLLYLLNNVRLNLVLGARRVLKQPSKVMPRK